MCAALPSVAVWAVLAVLVTPPKGGACVVAVMIDTQDLPKKQKIAKARGGRASVFRYLFVI